MPNKLFDYADPEHPLLRGAPGPETGAGLGGGVGSGNAYDALMGYVRRVMATDPAAVQQALRDQAAAERQRSVDMGYADPVTGLPTAKGAADIAGQWGRGVMLGTTAPGEAPGITVYHGSPHSFDRFDLSKIGTGEGAQAYGHGLYFAENEGVARSYRDKLAPGGREYVKPDAEAIAKHQDEWDALVQQRRAAAGPDYRGDTSAINAKMDALHSKMVDDTIARNPNALSPGSMYQVNIAADPEHFLHWDKPLSEQSPYVQAALEKTGQMDDARRYFQTNARRFPDGPTGEDLHEYFRLANASDRAPADTLNAAGIPGIRYYDAGSRGAGAGSHNYVVFDDATLDILRKYGIAGLGLGGAAAGNALDQGSDNAQ